MATTMEYARVTAKRFGLKHREIYFTPDILVADIPKVAASTTSPLATRRYSRPSTALVKPVAMVSAEYLLAMAVMSFSGAIHATPRNSCLTTGRGCPARCAMAFWARCSGCPSWPSCP